MNLFVTKQVAEKNLALPSKILEVRPTAIDESELAVPLSAFGDGF